MGRGSNGDEAGKVKATQAKLQRILLRARLLAAKDAQAAQAKHLAAVERARQARVRAQRRRKG